MQKNLSKKTAVAVAVKIAVRAERNTNKIYFKFVYYFSFIRFCINAC